MTNEEQWLLLRLFFLTILIISNKLIIIGIMSRRKTIKYHLLSILEKTRFRINKVKP